MKFLIFGMLASLSFSPIQKSAAQEESLQQPDLSQKAQELKQDQEPTREAIGETRISYIGVHAWAIGSNPPTDKKSAIQQYIQVVNGLNRPEFFKVFDNGKEQKIDRVFQEQEIPIHLGILMETSVRTHDSKLFFDDYFGDILKKQLRREDKYLFLAYDDKVRVLKDLQAPSSDPKNIFKYPGIDWKSQGGNLRDAVGAALSQLQADPLNPDQRGIVKRILLLVTSEGAKDASTTDTETLLEQAKKANAQIITITIKNDRNTPPRPSWAGGTLAGLTGGMEYLIFADTILPVFNIINKDERTQGRLAQKNALSDIYTSLRREVILAYYLNGTEPLSNGWRNLDIQLNPVPEVESIKKKGGFKNILILFPQQYYLGQAEPSQPNSP